MPKRDEPRSHDAWASLRFAIVGPLLASPPRERGELRSALEDLARQSWCHPITGEPVQFAVSTIERWYYRARSAPRDPVGALRNRVRQDVGTQASLSPLLRQAVQRQYDDHPSWTVQLHYDNLEQLVLARARARAAALLSDAAALHEAPGTDAPEATPPPPHRRAASRPRTARAPRGAQLRGRVRPRPLAPRLPRGLAQGADPRGALDPAPAAGRARRPLAPGLSRPVVPQRVCREPRPRTLPGHPEAGASARADDRQRRRDAGRRDRQGLARLGIVHATTLPYSAYQNAKQEHFWLNVENRLLAMLENEEELTLGTLNEPPRPGSRATTTSASTASSGPRRSAATSTPPTWAARHRTPRPCGAPSGARSPAPSARATAP